MIGVNIRVALSNCADMVHIAISKKIDVIFAEAGLPLDLPKSLTLQNTIRLVPIILS